ncbi:hypothetical protein CTA2_12760 [Colletotrichum tanaceti]|nr:hypothetical protein CTA2_12760 [Colletotrichum tanaceti]
MGVTTVYGLGQLLSIILICSPVEYNWTRWDGNHVGRCGNITLMTYINGGANITLDFSLFVLPVTQFINVSWTSRKKIGVSVIFLTGLFVTVCSGIRLATVGRFANTQNPTYDFTDISIWSLIEMRMSVICACMPGMTAFARRMTSRLRPDNPRTQAGNQPRTGRRSMMRRIQNTLTRIPGVGEARPRDHPTWGSSTVARKTMATKSQPSTIDPNHPEYVNYMLYARFAEADEAGTQLQTLNSRAAA